MGTLIDQRSSLPIDAGMAPFLNHEIRVYSPVVSRGKKIRRAFSRESVHYWFVRAATNYFLQVAKHCDFVIGVAVVTAQGTRLEAFTSQFELVKQVDRSDGSASYMFCASRAHDDDMGDIWVVKVLQECL